MSRIHCVDPIFCLGCLFKEEFALRLNQIDRIYIQDLLIYVMNLPINLKIRKSGDQVGHRRSKTDYANVKKLVDNFTKQTIIDLSQKDPKLTQFGVQVKEKSMKMTHNRGNNKSTFGQSYIATEYHEKATVRKNQTFNVKIDLPLKKCMKNPMENRETIRPTQGVQKIADRYEWETKVGSGTFGTVHKARDKKTLETVAIKKVYQDKKYKNRELEILKILKHPNVLEMRDHFFSYEGEKQYLNVVMQFFPLNLYDYIQASKGKRLSKLKLKIIIYQLFRALLYLQEKRIAHRDIKPHNILIRQSDLKVVICDFGSAKILVPGEENISYICSRCYRAPELIFENTQYTTQIDVWSTGCVLVQMIIGSAVFRANSNLQQLIEIMKVLGSPNTEEILEMNPNCDLDKFQLPKIPKKDWTKVMKTNLDEQFLDLVEGIMQYSPKKRLTPFQVLQHRYFDELRIESIYEHLRSEFNIPELFNFAQELSSTKYDLLVPKWYHRYERS